MILTDTTVYLGVLKIGTETHFTVCVLLRVQTIYTSRKACRGLKQRQAHNCCILLRPIAKTQFQNLKQISPEKELRCLVLIFTFMCLWAVGLPILLQETCDHWPIPGIYKSLTEFGNWDWGRAVPFLGYINEIFFAVQGAFLGRRSFRNFVYDKYFRRFLSVFLCYLW